MTYLLFQLTNYRAYDLLVDDIKRRADGSIKTAWVINGEWNLELTHSEILAKSGPIIITRLPYLTVREIEVTGRESDYNGIMQRASAELLGVTH